MDVILLFIRLFLAAILVVAGAGKLLDMKGGEKVMTDFGVPRSLATAAAVALSIAEIVIAVLFLSVSTSWFAAIAALVLMLTFIVGMIWQLAGGNTPDCHCFGQFHTAPVSPKSIIRNIIFAALGGFLIAQGRNFQGLSFTQMTNETILQMALGLGVIGALGAALLYLKRIYERQSEIMRRIDALELTLHEGGFARSEPLANPHEGLPIGAPAPDFVLPDANGKDVSLADLLQQKMPLLFFYVGPNCVPCTALIPEIDAWKDELKDKVGFIFLSNGDAKENTEKFGSESQILLQAHREVAEAFSARWTPTAFLVNPQGAIASHLAVGDAAIRELVENIKNENIERHNFYITNGSESKIGENVPEFSLADLSGKQIGASDLRGRKTLVTFWSMTCPHCTAMMEELKNWDKQKGADAPDLIVFSDGDAEAHKDLELDSPILLDKDYKTSEKLGMYGTPSAILVDENGKIVSETAIGAGNIWALVGKRK